jgi:hypothetical protein
MTYKQPYVRALTQFLLVDDKPRAGARPGTRQYWSTPDTGLLNLDGSPKPAYAAFRIPIWVPDPRHGSRVTIWGQLRPADHQASQAARLQFRPRGGDWTTLTAVVTSNSRGFLVSHVSLPSPGWVRLAWRSPKGDTFYSRTVVIR